MNTTMHFIDAPTIYRFEEIRDCIEKVVSRGVRDGEYTADDVRQLILKGYAYVAYAKGAEGDVEIACVWEMIYYPRITTVNVMALGGNSSKENWAKYGPVLMDLWKKQGAEYVECLTSKAMARLLKSIGFPVEPTYVLSRGKL